MSRLRYAILGALVLAVATSARAQGPDFSGKTVAELLVLMDDNAFKTREAATEELQKRLPNLGKADLAKVVNASFDASLEVRKRVEPLIKKYLVDLDMSPKTKTALDLVQVRLAPDNPKELNRKFTFGGFKGEVPLNVFGKDKEQKVYIDLNAKWAAYRDYMSLGATEEAAKRLDEMKKFITDLTPAEFSYLNLTKDGKAVTKDEVLEVIAAAKVITNMAKKEIEDKMGAIPAGPLPKVQVAGAGPVGLGQSVGLGVGGVLTPGALDYSWVTEELAYGPAPLGYTSLGPVYSLRANEDLLVYGMISLSIQYGDSSGYGYGITDPSGLGIVRVANGSYQFLDTVNDFGSQTITGTYTASTSPGGFDQFGEFMLVQAVPEPTTLALAVVGLLLLAGCALRWRRRRLARLA